MPPEQIVLPISTMSLQCLETSAVVWTTVALRQGVHCWIADLLIVRLGILQAFRVM
jgi:hypothetical protein